MVQLKNALLTAVVAMLATVTVIARPFTIAEFQLEARSPQGPGRGGLKGNPYDHKYNVEPVNNKPTGAGPKKMHEAAAKQLAAQEAEARRRASQAARRPREYDEVDHLVRRETPPKSILKTSPSTGPKKKVRFATRGYDEELEVREIVLRELFGLEIDELE